jgi:ABC-2 type transport system permease protein
MPEDPRPGSGAGALLALTHARLLEFVRDPAAVFWVFGFPVILAVVLGIAFRSQGAPGIQGRYIAFLIPGLIGMNIMGSTLWGMGYAIVDGRRRKLLKRFVVTPMRRSHYLLAFFLSRVVFMIAEVVLLLLFGWLVFDVGVRGSFVALAAITLAGMMAFTGLALLIASRTESTEVAGGLMNLVQLPMWLLSGAFFDYTRFPEVAHPFIRLLPLTAINDSMRAVMGDGAGLLDCWGQLALLLAWAAVSFGVALRIFRWQ